jgi:hypothetical protein
VAYFLCLRAEPENCKKSHKNIRGSKRTEFLESYGIDSGLWFHTEGPDSLSDCHAGSVWLLIPGRIAALKAYQIEEIENFLIFAVLCCGGLALGGLISPLEWLEQVR